MGDGYVNDALARAAGTPAEGLQELVTTHLWGAVWARPGLDRRSRSLITIGVLAALRADLEPELEGHVRGALRNGLSRREITEAVIHTAGYCGVPAALSAMRTVQRILDAQAE
ncbi:carboxymuconolactone decarboxylase family protein [Mycolicibacterium mengxianglii]|uniref:carboxymuconolactone decarboxylase family protein n=1 Tax=Mycolicibacterium mengxianglii TaxID=2736649 RepID=UPI0018EF0F06|nr:carboxymuconolactone decarboxylase family protein [Mycolicibacterium mengxianglii]